MAEFATLDDLRNASISSAGFTQIDVSPNHQMAGFTGQWLAAAPVPEPATFCLFGLGLAGIGLVRKRRSS